MLLWHLSDFLSFVPAFCLFIVNVFACLSDFQFCFFSFWSITSLLWAVCHCSYYYYRERKRKREIRKKRKYSTSFVNYTFFINFFGNKSIFFPEFCHFYIFLHMKCSPFRLCRTVSFDVPPQEVSARRIRSYHLI